MIPFGTLNELFEDLVFAARVHRHICIYTRYNGKNPTCNQNLSIGMYVCMNENGS